MNNTVWNQIEKKTKHIDSVYKSVKVLERIFDHNNTVIGERIVIFKDKAQLNWYCYENSFNWIDYGYDKADIIISKIG